MIVFLSGKITSGELKGISGRLPKGAIIDFWGSASQSPKKDALYLNDRKFLPRLKQQLRCTKRVNVVGSQNC